MSSVSSEVKLLLENKPFVLDALGRGILSLGNFAEEIRPEIEMRLGKKVKDSAIVMALRRYSEEIQGTLLKSSPVDMNGLMSGEIIMKTNICDFNVRKTHVLMNKLKMLYDMVNIERGDFLNVTVGNNEISISVSDKYYGDIEKFLEEETVYSKQKGLVSLTLVFSGDFLNTPGVVFQVIRRLAWENINLYEIVSTMTELTVVIKKENSIKGYEVLQKYLEGLNPDV